MRQMTFEDTKRVGVEILKAVHDYCVNNNLKYVLAYGTLLGAVRHKGYIPWDDDIDIVMPREDYDKFVQGFDMPNYGVKDYSNDPNYPLHWAKVYDKNTVKIEGVASSKKMEIGFNIDIFPCDEISSIEEYRKLKEEAKGILFKYKLAIADTTGMNLIKGLIKKTLGLLYLGKANKYAKLVDRYLDEHKDRSKEATIYGYIDSAFPEIDYLFPIDMFDDLLLLDFENEKFYCPKKYDEILTQCYGDYMTPPKQEEQVTHHTFNSYFKD